MTMPINRSIAALGHSPVVIQGLLRGFDETRIRQSRDGGDGWNPIEVLCHLYDYDGIWQERIASSSADNPPAFVPYPADELAIQNGYAEQSYEEALARFLERRRELIAFVKTISQDEANTRVGVHPTIGALPVSEQLALIGLHDLNHIEQITRALGLGERF